ncbi:MAG: preprotein translocase subunit YajC [Opitutales bacterium]|jgi:preprotein translocase subunit YajC|nr:preprotein translocase subunit YajC [Opitutales bacterium]MDP4642807.1 preprotein translocase subunit YajC [Opitutales bacterium]MDP4694537.1 preprotein translocase subunit YajC [Opitutales bacterium]MDP4778526.1 preprotein translocase subunit YajC [Opitutales bacterium]MDP4879353.1 preprotein translocase subunit YajC [Opitutales bacterium]
MAFSDISFFLSVADGSSSSGLQQLIPIGLLFVGMWFLVIAPQRKRQKAHDTMLTALQSGDEIVTSGGIYGTITNVKDDRFVVRIADSTKVEIGKTFIATKITPSAE